MRASWRYKELRPVLEAVAEFRFRHISAYTYHRHPTNDDLVKLKKAEKVLLRLIPDYPVKEFRRKD